MIWELIEQLNKQTNAHLDAAEANIQVAQSVLSGEGE